jgi:hypothetical protein
MDLKIDVMKREWKNSNFWVQLNKALDFANETAAWSIDSSLFVGTMQWAGTAPMYVVYRVRYPVSVCFLDPSHFLFLWPGTGSGSRHYDGEDLLGLHTVIIILLDPS